jgi:methylenetetrahydrofolate dehydrogenase (NADP+) / methenyltetrahydrofolate cyclohydrolase
MLVNGKEIAERILKELESKPTKKVCFLSFNETDASRSFVSIKTKVAERLGILVERVSKEVSNTEEAVEIVIELSKGVDGLVVQLPLGENLDTEKVLNSIPKEVDIDLLGESAKNEFRNGKTKRVPPVAGAVLEILNEYDVELKDKNIALLGQGRLVGEPVSFLLEKLGCDYKVVDKFTPEDELFKTIEEADILVSGIGVPHFLKLLMIKEGVVLIDAGTSSDQGKLAGDADPSCELKASLMTPVPGGVGPVTVAILFSNIYNY